LEDLPTIYLRPEEKPKPLDITLVRIGALRTIMAGLAWFERDLIREIRAEFSDGDAIAFE
jgi:hypothetical protein